jgi:hypothetical protein
MTVKAEHTYTADRRHTALHAIITQIHTFNINEPPSSTTGQRSNCISYIAVIHEL